MVPLGELVRVEKGIEDKSIYHKNLMPVTYVTADIAGAIESPVYAILKLGPEIDKIQDPRRLSDRAAHGRPAHRSRTLFDEVGRRVAHHLRSVPRLGIAFAAVLILIYGLVVGWFQSFLTPLIIMAAIPFSLVGILPAHGLLHAFFTATSMIGFIAGAGIVVRNSIILVDFIELRLREGMPLDQAVIDAGAVRFRPMMLTAAAVVVGSSVILFDPIFQGLAIALMAGEIASLLLSRMTVPVLVLRVQQKEDACMNVDRYLRMIAGVFVMLTLALGYWVSPYWYLFTAFVGLNLFQSAFTNWCPMMTILRKLGVRSS